MPLSGHTRRWDRKKSGSMEHILASAKQDGRYGKRAKEVAARTVLKHYKEVSAIQGK